MIRNMMNSRKCVIKLGVKNSIIFIDMSKNKNGGKYRIFNESKTVYIECICESEAF